VFHGKQKCLLNYFQKGRFPNSFRHCIGERRIVCTRDKDTHIKWCKQTKNESHFFSTSCQSIRAFRFACPCIGHERFRNYCHLLVPKWGEDCKPKKLEFSFQYCFKFFCGFFLYDCISMTIRFRIDQNHWDHESTADVCSNNPKNLPEDFPLLPQKNTRRKRRL